MKATQQNEKKKCAEQRKESGFVSVVPVEYERASKAPKAAGAAAIEGERRRDRREANGPTIDRRAMLPFLRFLYNYEMRFAEPDEKNRTTPTHE